MKNMRAEIIRLMREDFDPTPANWDGREWYDNAEDVADKICALYWSEKPPQVSDEPCVACGGSGNIFSQKFDRQGNERVLRCVCKEGASG